MKKKVFYLLIIVLLLIGTTSVLAGWEEKITGSMADASNIPGLSVQLSAWDNGDGTYGGNAQYYYSGNGNKFHIAVTKVCTGTISGYPVAVAMGPINYQEGPWFGDEGDWGYIAIMDKGDAGPDRLRAGAWMTEAAAINACNNLAGGSFPATVGEGDFRIRTK